MDPVIIVGAGLGGLLLALLLETPPPSSISTLTPAIPYIILERSTERTWPIEGGGVIFLTPQIYPLLARLGILDALREISRPVAALTVYERHRYAKASSRAFADFAGGAGVAGSASPQGERSASSSGSGAAGSGFDDDGDDDGASFLKTRYEYDTLAISRPELYNFLVDRIPEEKLVLGKQVHGLVFQDIAHGGTRSAAPVPVPVPDTGSGSRSSGSTDRSTEAEVEEVEEVQADGTRELDPDRFELLKNEYSDVRVLVSQEGVHPFAFWCVPMTENRICWMLEDKLAEEQICPETEDFTQDQQAISQLCEFVRSIPSACGKGVTVGEILDSTPEETAVLLSREEGYFSTWTYGNVALMGDGAPVYRSADTSSWPGCSQAGQRSVRPQPGCISHSGLFSAAALFP
ncbi:hypothetical protein BGX30_010495 [Mortierella sp. GBA39]|nr:hypothetical protein BGX30_010495 [Mortierella sp. GBA39]